MPRCRALINKCNTQLTFFFLSVDLPTADVQAIKGKLAAADVAFVAERPIPGSDHTAVYFVVKTVTQAQFFVELKFKQGANLCKITVKSAIKAQSEFVKNGIAKLLMA